MGNFIDDFLSGLENDKQKPRESGNRIQKILMSVKDNQGTVVFAPFMNKDDHKFYKVMTGVREFNAPCSLYRNGEDSVWMRILPKDMYGELNAAQSQFYDEVAGLFDQLDADLGDWNDKYTKLRYRTYSLFHGVLINHVNSQKTKLTDNINKAVLLIFPSRGPVNELATAIQSKINATNGSKEWIPAIFSNTDKGREGCMSINFEHPEGVIGYKTQVSFEFNSSFSKMVDPEAGFPEEVVSLMGDPIGNFISWENGENGYFNDKLFIELKEILSVELKTANKAPKVDEPLENKNGVDPMLSSGALTAQPAAESAPAPQPEAAPEAAAGDGEIKLPF
jgi:hypothetical protein